MLSPLVVGLTALTSLAVPLLLPARLVYAVPLAGALINLQWMYDEYYYLRAWASRTSDSNKALGEWYSAWQSSPGPLPAVIGLPLMWSGAARVLYQRNQLDTASLAYGIGLALAIVHMPAGQKAFPLLKKVASGNGAMQALDAWLGMHWWRLWMVDAPAVAAFAYGMYLI